MSPFVTGAGIVRAALVFVALGLGLLHSWWPRDRQGRPIHDMAEAERAIVLRLVKRPPPPGFGQMLFATMGLGFALLAHALSH